MSKKFKLTESEKNEIQKLYSINESSPVEERKFCHGGNVKKIEDIIGSDENEDYIDGIKIRKGGINGIVDKLELLKVVRLLDKLSDGGENLAFTIMNDIKGFKPYKFYDETRKECITAMDKIIELYKENEHGEELVKDIEKVMNSHHINPRAKEFLKHSINIIRE